MQDVYSNEARQVFQAWKRTIPLNGLVVDIKANRDWVEDLGRMEEWLNVILYRDNFESFSVADRLRIHHYISELIKDLRLIIPTYLEVESHVPA